MFVAIVGTRLAGKSTVESFLVKQKGFLPVKILQNPSDNDHQEATSDEQSLPLGTETEPPFGANEDLDGLSFSDATIKANRVSFLTLTSPTSSCLPSPAPGQTQCQPLLFRSPSELLAHITKNWRTNFVTIDLTTQAALADFMTRPFVLVVNVDAPLLTRYHRSLEWSQSSYALEEFIKEHDMFYYGSHGKDTPNPTTVAFELQQASKVPYRSLSALAAVHVINSFRTVDGLYDHLEKINLLDSERLRPGWDTYFMQLASLASQRSNCMKRRVGAILVRNKRVVSTGYNGTPRGVTNCNEGGCGRCNSASESSDECLCLHAEENALLEAGRERVGDGAVLYCNTCPCLKCTIKIIQTGIREVVYNLSYKVDDASAALFAEAGVILRRHAFPA